MNQKVKIVLGILLLGIAGMTTFAILSEPSDQEKIKAAMAEAVLAAEEGRSGPVLDVISRRATLDGYGGASPGEIGDYIKRLKPKMVIASVAPVVKDDKAQFTSPVTVEVGLLGMRNTFDLKTVQFDLEREPGVKWGLFPTSKWRLVSIQTDSDVARELTGQ
jgi:hypothetical protein